MSRLRPLVGAALLAMTPSHGWGQPTELVLELGGSQVRPPIGLEGDPANFVVGGLRAAHLLGLDGHLTGSLLMGRSLDASSSGDFLSAEVTAGSWEPVFGGLSAGSELRVFGFDVGAPFPYRAAGIEGDAGLRYRSGGVTASLTGVAGFGRSEVEIGHATGDPLELVVDDLWRYGVTAELYLGGGPLAIGVAGGIHESAGGTYNSLGGRAVFVLGPVAAQLSVDTWETPLDQQTTGGIAFVIPVGSWVTRGFAGRSEPDPLTLAEPGSGGGGLLIGRRIAGRGYEPARKSLYEVEGPDGAQRRVRFEIEHADAAEVSLIGDFSLWEPIPMTRDDDRWVTVVDVEEGTYHFGFLVDGEWYLPERTQDAVPDEWGRLSATLVVNSGEAGSEDTPEREGAVR